MAEPSAQEYEQVRKVWQENGQDQVFAFWDKLTSSEKGTLFKQIQNFKPDRINELFKKVTAPAATSGIATDISPLPAELTISTIEGETPQADLDKWYQQGLDLAAQNKVGVILMAGGQGTRLGSSAPKGCFDIGLASHKSLFQLQAERIRKVQSLAGQKHGKKDVVVPWYVMTSGPTRGPTQAFFEEKEYFGLNKENVFIFEQGVLPCISNDGKILLEEKGKVRHLPSSEATAS